MAIVGNVGYYVPTPAAFALPKGKTYLVYNDPATANGILSTITVNVTGGILDTAIVSVFRLVGIDYVRQDFATIIIPATSGEHTLSLSKSLSFQAGDFITIYSPNRNMKSDGGPTHRHLSASGDVSIFSGPVSPNFDCPICYGDLEGAPPPTVGRPFWMGKSLLQIKDSFDSLDLAKWEIMRETPFVSGGELHLPSNLAGGGWLQTIKKNFHLGTLKARVDFGFSVADSSAIYLLNQDGPTEGMAFYKTASYHALYTWSGGILESTSIGLLPPGYMEASLIPDNPTSPSKIELWINGILRATNTIEIPDPVLEYQIFLVGSKNIHVPPLDTLFDWVELV